MALLKERLKNGEQVLGTMVTTFASPDIAKILQSCGFDFFIVDCEHGAFTTREAANIIAVARGIGTAHFPGFHKKTGGCKPPVPHSRNTPVL